MNKSRVEERLIELRGIYPVEELKFDPPTSWVEYHMRRIEEACKPKVGAGWDEHAALTCIRELEGHLKNKYETTPISENSDQ